MVEDGGNEQPHVIGDDVIAALRCGDDAGRAHEGERGAAARTHLQRRIGAGRLAQVDDVAHDRLGDADLRRPVHHRDELLEADDGTDAVDRVAGAVRHEHLDLGVRAGVAELQLEQEPVELRLGQREGAGELDRVLGRQHEERRRQPVRRAVDGDVALGHRLEQRRLRLRRRAVDLVGEEDVGEDRAGPEDELAGLAVEHR